MITFIQSHQLIVGFSAGLLCGHIVGFKRARYRAQRWLDRAIKNGTLTIQRR